jgi:serine/threonine-protein kinase
VWVDRSGSVASIDPDWVEPFFFPSLSPDGTRIAVSVEDAESRSIWIKDLPDGIPRQLTFDEGISQTAAWTLDGQRLTYSHFGRGIMERWVDGRGEATLVLEQEGRGYWGPKWSHDMRWLIYTSAGDIFGYQPGSQNPPIRLVDDGSDEGEANLSPDGRWLAYVSNRSGRNEVYVRPFPDVTESQWKVSAGGGSSPLWAHNFRELFYVNESDQLVAVEYAAEPTFRVLREHPLFSVDQFQIWVGPVVAIDDQRFLMGRTLQDAERTVMLTFNLFTELERVAPTR